MQEGPLTPAQTEAIQKAYALLGEHFDHMIFIVNVEIYDGAEAKTATKMCYKGGFMSALGMLQWGTVQLLDSKPPNG